MSDRILRPVYHVRQAVERGEVVRCTGCVYYRLFSWGGYNGLKACHYMLDTGIPRGIPARACYKHRGTPYSPAEEAAP